MRVSAEDLTWDYGGIVHVWRRQRRALAVTHVTRIGNSNSFLCQCKAAYVRDEGKPVVSTPIHDCDLSFFNINRGVRKLIRPR